MTSSSETRRRGKGELHEPERCEAASTTAALHEQGLRVLARIIACRYIRDIEPKGKVVREPKGEMPLSEQGGER